MALAVLITVVATGIIAFLPSLRFGAVNNLPALLQQSVRFGFWVFVTMLIALVPFLELSSSEACPFDALHRLLLHAFFIRLCVAQE